MLTLDRIREEILNLMETCEKNPERAEPGIQEIFYMLMCADQPFYLIYAGDSPLLSPAASDGKNLYLRLFSHSEVAEKYIKRTDTMYKAHTLLDILQIGRWAFLGGANGFILNEGDRWIRISIPEFMSLFFSRIYGDASLCDQSCISAISFINEVRRNSSYHYGLELGEKGEWTGNVQPGLLPPLTIGSLFHASTKNLQVEKDGATFSYSHESLYKALLLCGYDPNNLSLPSGDHYEDDPMGPSPFADGTWRIGDPDDLALSFHPFSPQETESPPASNSNPAAGANPIAAVVPVQEKVKRGLFPFLRSILHRKSAETGPVQRVDASDSEPEDPTVSIQEPERPPEPARAVELGTEALQADESPIEPVPKSALNPAENLPHAEEIFPPNPPDHHHVQKFAEILRVGERSRKQEKKLGRKKLWFMLAAFLVIALIVGGFFVARHLQYKDNLKNFRIYIAAQDYANAFVLYQDAKLGSSADGYLMNEVDGLVLRYANNEISAEELSASLKALSNFSTLSQELEIAKLTASKLEESKNAYVVGKDATDIYERLDTWRQVVQLDAVNYAAVQQSVEDNESRYVDVLRSDIEYYRTRILEFAANRVDVLSYWYPDNKYVPALVKEFSSIQSVPLSYYPISVSNVQIRQETNGYWTLYVNWNNLSVKTISSICFSVVALGENGDIITCKDMQGEWTIFDARDNNQYEPGQEPSFERYYWIGAFYGPDVRSVKLTAVNIVYRDGSSSSYISDIDLDSIRTS